jgi:hypothetical protein
MHYIAPRYCVSQYHVEQSYIFRSVMGSSSGNQIKVTLHKTELAMHAHNKICEKVNQLKCRRLLHNGHWYTGFWRQLTYLRKDNTVSTLRPLYPPRKDPISSVQEAGWAPGPVWTGAENLAFIGIRCPDRPARSESLYWLRYLGGQTLVFTS